MPQTFITPDAVQRVHDFDSLLAFFADGLGWDVDPESELDEITFDWDAHELNLSETAARRLAGGVVRQLQPLTANQPWGVFFVEFADSHLYRTALREVLRALVPKQRGTRSDQQTWQQENLLFICATKDYNQFTFAHFRGADERRAVLAAFGWERGDTHLRTLCEYNLPALRWPDAPHDADAWLTQWRAAFDVEAVTDKFFRDYSKIFQAVESEVRRSIADTEAARLYTQRLFNRLMFLYFIQKKGWLSYNGDRSYLRALFTAAGNAGENFLRERLYWLFFWGLSNVGESREVHAEESLRARRGDVPYLNGGLFDMEDERDSNRDAVQISNEAFAAVLELFERYNFTVTESTPLDVQVAVDPEMLGKVFEELVTGRHESGSYYTPRPIVSFMCREALKHYLSSVLSSNFSLASAATRQTEVWTQNAIARFVDYGDAGELNDPESVLEALRDVKVCDPACGSGAYLLGMLQELMRLRAALFQSKRLDDKTQYQRKRAIIENNLYGVDKDRFAVQVACLRLWLSLAIESDTPQPLPNLDFKIGCGDSLTAPAPQETQPDLFRTEQVRAYQRAKNEYLRCSEPTRKHELRAQITHLRGEIAAALQHPGTADANRLDTARARLRLLEQNLAMARNPSIREQLAQELARANATLAKLQENPAPQDAGFDWAVEFAEVFIRDEGEGIRDELFASGSSLIPHPSSLPISGFDIVLANPPYVRQELLGREYKERRLKPVFAEVYSGTADLYVYFYARAMQLLRRGGASAFISSNKWLRAGYGEKLRQELLDKKAFHLVVDFGELPVFKAATFPAIFIWQNEARNQTPTSWSVVKDLPACYADGVREHIFSRAETLPATQFGIGKARLTSVHSATLRQTMEQSGVRLKEYVNSEIYRGVLTGLNEAFVINRETRDALIATDQRSAEIIKPLLAGDDVRRYETHFREKYLIFTRRGIAVNCYQAVKKYLSKFQEDLTPKKSSIDKRGRKPGLYEWYEIQDTVAYYKAFESPKIVYPEIGKEARFSMDTQGLYPADTIHIISTNDWFLLGVLNSSSAFFYLKKTCSVLGDEDKAGRLRFKPLYMEQLPIPDAPASEREVVAQLAREAQGLHAQRRRRVEQFLRECGTSPAQSGSRNPLEQPWTLAAHDFAKRARRADPALLTPARDATAELTARIAAVEREIDERVATLYGLDVAEIAIVEGRA